MHWVGVCCRGISLPEIMARMRVWLDRHGYQTESFDHVASGSGTLVRVRFADEADAVNFAQAFAGWVSPDRPCVQGSESRMVNEPAWPGNSVWRSRW